MSKFNKFSIGNRNYNTAYKLDLKMILLSIGCYFLNPVVATIIFIIALLKNNRFIAYHAFHSVIVTVLFSAIYYCFVLFNIKLGINIIHIILRISLNVFAIFGAYYLLNNKVYTVPFISKIFNRYFK